MNRLLIHGGRVIDGSGAAPRPAAVLVEGERISAVGSEADLAANRLEAEGRAPRRLDATGHVVMPGLIDGHCHISFDEPNSNDELFFHRRHGLAAIVAARNARKALQAGVTGIQDADLASAPRVEELAPELARILGGRTLVAHQASFERHFLSRYVSASLRSARYLDTLELLGLTHPDAPDLRLESGHSSNSLRWLSAPGTQDRRKGFLVVPTGGCTKRCE